MPDFSFIFNFQQKKCRVHAPITEKIKWILALAG